MTYHSFHESVPGTCRTAVLWQDYTGSVGEGDTNVKHSIYDWSSTTLDTQRNTHTGTGFKNTEKHTHTGTGFKNTEKHSWKTTLLSLQCWPNV